MGHLLVTNDFPPKVGGIQSYLGELWRRLPPEETTVVTLDHPGAAAWDAAHPMTVHRLDQRALLPGPRTVRALDEVIRAAAPRLLVVDPAFPLGAAAPGLSARHGIPYAVVVHGAEVTIPGRLPLTRPVLARALAGAQLVISAGGYPAAEAERAARRSLPTVIVPPGVDTDRFRPATATERAATRVRLGLPADAFVVLAVSRLVPRKGFDVIIGAVEEVRRRSGGPPIHLAIAGGGRDRDRLERIAARVQAPVVFLGRVDDAELPALYAAADVFAMACRSRWAGLEQEGFGIVYLEAAASGVPQVAGRSGGAHEAVVHGETGLVVDDPRSVDRVADAIARLRDHPGFRRRLGIAGRARVEAELDYDALAGRLLRALRDAEDAGVAPVPPSPSGSPP